MAMKGMEYLVDECAEHGNMTVLATRREHEAAARELVASWNADAGTGPRTTVLEYMAELWKLADYIAAYAQQGVDTLMGVAETDAARTAVRDEATKQGFTASTPAISGNLVDLVK